MRRQMTFVQRIFQWVSEISEEPAEGDADGVILDGAEGDYDRGGNHRPGRGHRDRRRTVRRSSRPQAPAMTMTERDRARVAPSA